MKKQYFIPMTEQAHLDPLMVFLGLDQMSVEGAQNDTKFDK